MQILPAALSELIEAFGSLPGVGPRTAERYAYHVVRSDAAASQRLASSLSGVHGKIAYCKKTFALIAQDKEYSDLYTDPSRNKHVVAVVAEPFDIVALEKTGQFRGTYHVLGGLVSPIDNIGPEELHIPELITRIQEDAVTEVIIATNANVEGESTALYIQKRIHEIYPDINVTRLARGLPIGVDLEYADHITLGRALEGRTTL